MKPRSKERDNGYEGCERRTGHGGWADGTSWARVIAGLAAHRITSVAAPLPLTELADDVAALNRSIERMPGAVVLAGHAYAGAVIGLARPERVKALVYVTAFAPDEGEKLTDLFFRAEPHPHAPKLPPDSANLLWLPDEAFPKAFAQNDPLTISPCSPLCNGHCGSHA